MKATLERGLIVPIEIKRINSTGTTCSEVEAGPWHRILGIETPGSR